MGGANTSPTPSRGGDRTFNGWKVRKTMSRYDEKCKYDALQDKIVEYREQCKEAMRSACEDCDSHKTLGCLYYDPEEESFDYEECFRDSGGWE